MTTKIWLATIAIIIVQCGSAVQAQTDWPQRAVRIVTPLPAGGGTDLAARLFAERLAARWGQPVVVENRPGGDGIVGVASFLANKDDHTLLFATSATTAVLPVVNDKLPFDPSRELTPVASACNILLAIAATRTLPIDTLADFVAVAAKQPGKLNWAAAPGLPQFVMASFQKSRGLDTVATYYRDFRQPVQDLAEGRIHIMAAALTTLAPLAEAGKVRLLAVGSHERTSIAPDVPTVTEAGYPDLRMDGFVGFFGHAGTANAVRDRIAADVRAIADDPQTHAKLLPAGLTPRPGTTADFVASLDGQHILMRKLAGHVRPSPAVR